MLNAKQHQSEGELIAQAGKKGAVTIATNMAGRGVDIKLGGDPGSDELSEEVKNLGGLFVLGTERHESRRIDNQLRGRSGRQGDPGETQFFVSAEDDLMRIFGGDRMKNILTTLGVTEDQPIEHKMVSKSLESAQEKIEGMHFDARKHTLEYDNVMSHQRDTVYGRRRTLLFREVDGLKEYFLSLYGDDQKEVLVAKEAEIGKEVFYSIMKNVALSLTDSLWLEHLENMDYLRASVSLRAYGQREPLIEYKKEGLRMFRDMEALFVDKLFEYVSGLQKEVVEAALQNQREAQERVKEAQALEYSKQVNKQFASSDKAIAEGADRGQGTVLSDKKYGRNDRVIIVKDGQKQEIKYKKFDEFEADGWVVEE